MTPRDLEPFLATVTFCVAILSRGDALVCLDGSA